MESDQDIAARAEALVANNREIVADRVAFRTAQFDAGLAMVHFPEGYGGLGGSRGQQAVVDDVLRNHDAYTHDLMVNPIGIGMGAPTVLAYGSDELKEKHLRRIFTGEDIWCQLFSEPSNGSDVAGIPSRSVRDGDEWVVNGQKVWTTLAHVSNYGMLLTRTDPDVPKHKGLSYFVLDMHAPGVEVRPLYQMTGEAEFNEVFLTDVSDPRLAAPRGRGGGLARGHHHPHERARRPRRGPGAAGLGSDRRAGAGLGAAARPPRRRRPRRLARPGRRPVGRRRGRAPHQPAGQRVGAAAAPPGPRARSPSWPRPS